MEVHPIASTPPDWANLTPPLLQAILWSALEEPSCFHLPFFLSERTKEAAAAQLENAALSRLACVCRRWRAAVAAAVATRATWAVAVQRCSLATELLHLEQLRVASLDLRLPTWSEVGGGTACEALLSSATFQRQSGQSLTAVAGIPERLGPLLAAFPNLESVGLAEDYESTAFGVAGGKSHLAPMQLAPLLQLPCLSRLLLELGVVDMAQLPPQVSELTLVEVDRIVLPPAPGTSVTDRLIAVAEAAGRWARQEEGMWHIVFSIACPPPPTHCCLPALSATVPAAQGFALHFYSAFRPIVLSTAFLFDPDCRPVHSASRVCQRLPSL